MSGVVNYLESPSRRSGFTWARLLALVAGFLALLGFAAERANAGYTARVNNDTLTLTGNGASDQLALRLQAGVPTTLQVDIGDNGSADLSFDRAAFDRIVVNAGGGNDRVRMDEANGVFTDTETTSMNGQDDYDTLLGGAGAETFFGGAQNDRVDGNGGADIGLLGTGRDTFVWDPGDGSDIVEGQGGTDTLFFNGSGGSENFDFSANGNRLRFFRDLGNITRRAQCRTGRAIARTHRRALTTATGSSSPTRPTASRRPSAGRTRTEFPGPSSRSPAGTMCTRTPTATTTGRRTQAGRRTAGPGSTSTSPSTWASTRSSTCRRTRRTCSAGATSCTT
jgi:hypothetical protein